MALLAALTGSALGIRKESNEGQEYTKHYCAVQGFGSVRHNALSVEGLPHLMVESEVTPDHELPAHNVQDDCAHAPGLLGCLLQVLQGLFVVVHRAPLHRAL